MKLLCVDTSGPVCGVCVTDGEMVKSEYTAQNKNTHSVNLMPMIESCLHSAGMALSDVDAMAAVVGPGSFTGVRIGVATVKGMAHGAGKDCIAVNALEALSYGVGEFDGIVCPIQDARAGQVYGAAFRKGNRLMDDAPMKIEDYLAKIRTLAEERERFLFTGDGVASQKEKILEILGDRAVIAAPAFRFLRPAAAAALAEKGTPIPWKDLKEYYLRAPNAKMQEKLVEAARHGE